MYTISVESLPAEQSSHYWRTLFRTIPFFVFTLTRVALLGNSKGFRYSYFLRTANAIAPSHRIEIIST